MARRDGTSVDPVVDIFKSTLNFPTFDDLPGEHELDYRYWREDSRDGVYRHACTWFFLGEITYDIFQAPSFLRKRIGVRDRVGKDEIPIYFYPEVGFLDYDTLKKGHSICVLQAEKHHFLDLSIGLRIEYLGTVTVFPLNMSELFALSSTYAERKDSQCWSCGKEASCSKSLKKCAACKTAYYCDSACQTKDWKQRHRKWCKAIPKFLLFAKADLSKYDKKYWWH